MTARYFLFRAEAARGFAAALVLASAGAAGAGGLSPSTPLSGQILKAGHLRQPATMAIGQTVMAIPVDTNSIFQYVRRGPSKVVASA